MNIASPWIRISFYVVLLGGLVGAIWYADTQVRALRERAAVAQRELQDVPRRTANSLTLKKELALLTEQMKTIYQGTPSTNQLPDVIANISALAASSGVSAQVPVVQESAGKEKEKAMDSFSDVRIHVAASGDPENLATFLYRIEHLPYVMRVVSWTIDTTRQVAISSFTGVAPPAPGGEEAAPRGSSLEADIVIVTKNE